MIQLSVTHCWSRPLPTAAAAPELHPQGRGPASGNQSSHIQSASGSQRKKKEATSIRQRFQPKLFPATRSQGSEKGWSALGNASSHSQPANGRQ
eukprot:scaffold161220_cov18-Tisochrysis_lutea.AAC.1